MVHTCGMAESEVFSGRLTMPPSSLTISHIRMVRAMPAIAQSRPITPRLTAPQDVALPSRASGGR